MTVKKFRNRFTLCCISFIFLGNIISCSTTKNIQTKSKNVPSWTKNAKHPKYPKMFYLTAVGISKEGMKDADDRARIELSKEIKVHLKETDKSTHTEKIKGTGNNQEIGSFQDTTSGITISVDMEGVKISQRWEDSKMNNYYSLAVLNREKAANNLKKQIESAINSFKDLKKEANSLKDTNDLSSSLLRYIDSLNEIKKIAPLKTVYLAVRDELTKDIEGFNNLNKFKSDILSSIRDIVQNINLVQISDKNQGIKDMGNSLTPFTLKVTSGKDKRAVSGIPVKFLFISGKGTLNSEFVTGEDGLISTKLKNIESFENNQIIISAIIDTKAIFLDRKIGSIKNLFLPLQGKQVTYKLKKLSIDASKTLLPKSKDEAINDIVFQIVKNFNKDKDIKLSVLDFIELRTKNRLKFSNILESDLKTALSKQKYLNINVINKSFFEIGDEAITKAKKAGSDYMLSGGYYVEDNGLKIDVKLINVNSGIIESSASVLIKRSDLLVSDLTVESDKIGNKAYFKELQKLVSSKPETSDYNITLWTDKKEYRIGENIKIHVKTDKDCYITILNIGTSGKVDVIFPNKFIKNNFIKAGVTYHIPGKEYGFNITVSGPSGIERIKAIASGKPLTISEIKATGKTVENKFSDTFRIRDLNISVEKIKTKKWGESYYEMYIKPESDLVIYKGSRKIKIKPINMTRTMGKTVTEN